MVAFFIISLVVFCRVLPVRFWGYASPQVAFLEQRPKRIRVVGLVGENGPIGEPFHELPGKQAVVGGPGRQDDPDGAAPGIDNRMHLRVRPAPGPRDVLIISALPVAKTVLVDLCASRINPE